MLKVLKFGGSSLADASQFAKVKHIVDSDPSAAIVIGGNGAVSEIEKAILINDVALGGKAHVQRFVSDHAPSPLSRKNCRKVLL